MKDEKEIIDTITMLKKSLVKGLHSIARNSLVELEIKVLEWVLE